MCVVSSPPTAASSYLLAVARLPLISFSHALQKSSFVSTLLTFFFFFTLFIIR